MGRALAKWPIMKYTEESRIQKSEKAGQLGDLNFGGWMDGWCGVVWWKISGSWGI
jgi:hypothetical protein